MNCSVINVALVALDNMGFVANMVSLVLYFGFKMYLDFSTAANTLTNFMGSTFLLTVVGGFISDTYINRFHTALIFGTIYTTVCMLALGKTLSNYKHLCNQIIVSHDCGRL